MCYVHAPVPYSDCNHNVQQTSTKGVDTLSDEMKLKMPGKRERYTFYSDIKIQCIIKWHILI